MIWRSFRRLRSDSRSTIVNHWRRPASCNALATIDPPPWLTARDSVWPASLGLNMPVWSVKPYTATATGRAGGGSSSSARWVRVFFG